MPTHTFHVLRNKCTPIPHDKHLYQLVPMGTKLVKNLMFLDRIYVVTLMSRRLQDQATFIHSTFVISFVQMQTLSKVLTF